MMLSRSGLAVFIVSISMSLSLAAAGRGLPGVRAAGVAPAGNSCESIDLDQGWSPSESQEFWFTSQGSRLMPYSWFLALEVADPSRQALFRDRPNMDRYGYISVLPSPRNPDGLPIGFAKDTGSGDEHVGFTCAACHTGSLNIAGQTVIVEGGPALADFWTFLTEAVGALWQASTDPAKFDRFSKRVLRTSNPPAADLDRLRQLMKSKLTDLQTRLDQNTPKNPAGNGRVDAFGHIFTRVLAQDLAVPGNARPPYGPAVSAPVSYPFLWDTPQHDVVQWNGSAPNSRLLALGPLGRNVGEVLGVFGELEIVPGRKIPFLPFLTKPPEFVSSANIPNLIRLEDRVRTLWSPAWPKNCLPLADAATLARGKDVYLANCARCHRLLGPAERKDPSREITAVLNTLPEVVTDPTMAMNFVARKAKTGRLEGSPNLIRLGEFGPEATGHDLLLAAVAGVWSHDGVPVEVSGLKVNLEQEIIGFRRALDAARTARYKARPLNGIWATAPYLHNGSVPTLYDLLNPASERPSVFYVGSRELDSKKVGLVTSPVPGAFRFDTSPQGNWRNGHEFGTTLSRKDKDALLEFLKTL
jgi:hypothetical protein